MKTSWVANGTLGVVGDDAIAPDSMARVARRLEEGDAFPELTFEGTDGPVELRERLEGGPLVVAFERHFG